MHMILESTRGFEENTAAAVTRNQRNRTRGAAEGEL
jgi:hypothetical protein